MGLTSTHYFASICVGLLSFSAAGQSLDADTRPISFHLSTSGDDAKAQECLSNRFAKAGLYVVSYKTDNGVIVEGEFLNTFGGRGKAGIIAKVQNVGDNQLVTVRYRHPLSRKSVEKFVRLTVVECMPSATETPVDAMLGAQPG